jgi:hypothetical protein
MEVTQAMAGSVPLLTAPGEGLVQGGIIFQAGWAYETLPGRGITHLVEHLALSGENPADRHSNGSTGANKTAFYTTGSAEQVADFLRRVTDALRDLPLDLLDREVNVIRTEEEHAGSDSLATLRYGAQGRGLGDYRQLGLNRVTTREVREWSRRWFTAGNAVAYMTAKPPRGFRLDLPPGERAGDPPDGAVVPLPLGMNGPIGTAILDTVVPRGPAAQVYADAADRMLMEALRVERALSYKADAVYSAVNSRFARIVMAADSRQENNAAMVERFLATVLRLRDEPAPESVLAALRQQLDRHSEDQVPAVALLISHGQELLEGRQPKSLAEHNREYRDVTPGEVQRVAQEAWGNSIIQVAPPEGLVEGLGLFDLPLPAPIGQTLKEYRPTDPKWFALLTFAAEGLSLVVHQEPASAVRYQDAVALLTYPNGAVRVVGRDNNTVEVDPTAWQKMPPEDMANLVARFPERLRVPMHAKASPEAPAVPPGGLHLVQMSKGSIWLGMLMFVLTAAGAVLCISALESLRNGDFPVVLAFAVPCLGGAWAIWATLRRRGWSPNAAYPK